MARSARGAAITAGRTRLGGPCRGVVRVVARPKSLVSPRRPPSTSRRSRLVTTSSSASEPGKGRPRSKRAIALRLTLYSPAIITLAGCVLKAISFGVKPLGILMTCTMLGFTVPFGPQTLWDTVPCTIVIGLLLYFTSRMDLDWIAQTLIAVGGLAAIFLSWRLQGPVPSLPRRVPQYIQARLNEAYERESFKEIVNASKTTKPSQGKSRQPLSKR